jgi:hypothetical protein
MNFNKFFVKERKLSLGGSTKFIYLPPEPPNLRGDCFLKKIPESE